MFQECGHNVNSVPWAGVSHDPKLAWASKSLLLSLLQVLPIERGKGLHQPMMDDVIGKLSQGDWVHMFPEGTRSRSSTAALQSIKLGVGRCAWVFHPSANA
jgi:monolysocardiolipin acyltransferase